VTVGGLLTAELPSAAFELVVLSHVFEHIASPLPTLSRIAGLLTPTGRAVLIYPNPVGLGARLFRECWTEWDPPRHLVMPPLPAICSAARPNGLHLLSGRTLTRSLRGLAWSRHAQAGLMPTDAEADWRDKALGNLSNIAGRFGFQFGEEIVVSFAREARSGN
jgi:SAM-dependent methyltransferase